MLILKVAKNKALHSLQTVFFLKYSLKVKVWIFFNETPILVFVEFNLFLKNHWVGGMMLDICLFGSCQCMSLMSKFWHMYVIPYSNFTVIVEP